MSPFSCFGISIEGVSLDDVLAQHPRWIVTANPEILLAAKRDPAYAAALQKADLRVADGIGLVLIARLFGHTLHRVTGVDLAEAIIRDAAAQEEKIALIGGGEGTAEHALTALTQRHPNLHGIALHGGNITNDGVGDTANDEAMHRLILEAPDVILVAFGHPKQERWIANNLPNLPSVKTIIGIGGAIDYWAGNLPRAPRWMQSLGLEWLFRLFHEPTRWKRIWHAVVVFPLMTFLRKDAHS
ncbi:MAG: hypothetical protein RL141_876 [Candidatus Parcubacteria bacterium]|jgi:N-acetylglucosaminyldiphosphoundecaprenol N-acetyl-beta-D-mannosaminyltransferase